MTAQRGASAKRGGTLGSVPSNALQSPGDGPHRRDMPHYLLSIQPEGRVMTAQRGAPAKRGRNAGLTEPPIV
jgi:hypothetical protein